MQKTLLIGYLGKDPEMKYTPGGTAITTFTIASTERRQPVLVLAWNRRPARQMPSDVVAQGGWIMRH